jgi:hypothetical protein
MKSCGIRNLNRTAFCHHHHHHHQHCNEQKHPSHSLVFGPTMTAGSVWHYYRKSTALMVRSLSTAVHKIITWWKQFQLLSRDLYPLYCNQFMAVKLLQQNWEGS